MNEKLSTEGDDRMPGEESTLTFVITLRPLNGELDTEKLSALVNSWKTTISTGRDAFRLDEPSSEEMLVNVIQMSSSVTANPPAKQVIDVQPESEAPQADEGQAS